MNDFLDVFFCIDVFWRILDDILIIFLMFFVDDFGMNSWMFCLDEFLDDFWMKMGCTMM